MNTDGEITYHSKRKGFVPPFRVLGANPSQCIVMNADDVTGSISLSKRFCEGSTPSRHVMGRKKHRKQAWKPNPRVLSDHERNREMRKLFGGNFSYICRGCGRIESVSSMAVEIAKAEGRYIECFSCNKDMHRIGKS